jgi:hypothetical protein
MTHDLLLYGGGALVGLMFVVIYHALEGLSK